MVFESHIQVDSVRANIGERTDSIEAAAERSARAAQRLSVLAEMTGGIAHDFRSILAVIDSGLRLAQKSSDDPTKVSAFIADARDGIVRGLTLTSRLLNFAKQRELDACATDVNALLKDLELFLRYGAGSEVRICLELSHDISECWVDLSQFTTAILNLVINARDVMPNGGEIRISTAPWAEGGSSGARPGRYVRIRVEDDGCGMSDEVLRHIFEPFFTTKGEKGTGLGIPQVVASMRHVGGHVRIASTVGKGSTFDLFFPVVEHAGTAPSPLTLTPSVLSSGDAQANH
jgi:signal transduction histidine kinase